MQKKDFLKEMKKCRNLYQNADNLLQSIIDKIETEFSIVLSDIDTNAENADDIEQAICCYVQYGEYNPNSIWEEIVERSENIC